MGLVESYTGLGFSMGWWPVAGFVVSLPCIVIAGRKAPYKKVLWILAVATTLWYFCSAVFAFPLTWVVVLPTFALSATLFTCKTKSDNWFFARALAVIFAFLGCFVLSIGTERRIRIDGDRLTVHGFGRDDSCLISSLRVEATNRYWLFESKDDQLILTIEPDSVYWGPHGLTSGERLATRLGAWSHTSAMVSRSTGR